MGKVSVDDIMRIQTLRDIDFVRSRRNTQRTGSWTEHLLTQQSWLKTGLPPTAVTSSEKTNGHRTHQTLIILISMSGELCLNVTWHFNPSQIPSTRWRKSCKQYGMICHRTPSTRPYWALSKDCELVWKLRCPLWTCLQINCFRRVLNCTQAVTVWIVKFPCFRLISIQAVWWKL